MRDTLSGGILTEMKEDVRSEIVDRTQNPRIRTGYGDAIPLAGRDERIVALRQNTDESAVQGRTFSKIHPDVGESTVDKVNHQRLETRTDVTGALPDDSDPRFNIRDRGQEELLLWNVHVSSLKLSLVRPTYHPTIGIQVGFTILINVLCRRYLGSAADVTSCLLHSNNIPSPSTNPLREKCPHC
jgi:hypothetical protein